jgi:predicted nucleic acid-binding protein
MVAVDTSSAIAFLARDPGPDVTAFRNALAHYEAVFPPLVVTELFSNRIIERNLRIVIFSIPKLAILDGYWERAGQLRGGLLQRGFKAAIADSLIAQSCIDHRVALITRDRDFRNFAQHAGLRLEE